VLTLGDVADCSFVVLDLPILIADRARIHRHPNLFSIFPREFKFKCINESTRFQYLFELFPAGGVDIGIARDVSSLGN
jgi:hypothetical protein